MSDQPDPLTKVLAKTRKRKELTIVEYELNEIVDKKLKKAQEAAAASAAAVVDADVPQEVEEEDDIFIPGLVRSVGAHIKTEALKQYSSFKSTDTSSQTMISLGLNSILSLSVNFPEGQSKLFDQGQWRYLKRMFPPKKYETSQYEYIKSKLGSLLGCCKARGSWGRNWAKLYRTTKALQKEYDAEKNDEWEEEDFCLFFVESILNLQKHHGYLFDDDVDKSEWDYICKLWSPIMEKLFARSGLRLKWGDTKLSLGNIEEKSNLKADLRILQDETIQRYNQEIDISAFEASKGDPGVQKFQSDHCKLMMESKTIIDMYINKGFGVDNVDCIQICGLDIVISNLCLSAPGVYIGNELFYGSVINSLSQIEKMLDIALNLLAFRDAVVKIKRNYQEEKATIKQSKKTINSSKYSRALEKTPKEILKKSWVRGTWIAYRDGKSKLPPPPHKLVA